LVTCPGQRVAPVPNFLRADAHDTYRDLLVAKYTVYEALEGLGFDKELVQHWVNCCAEIGIDVKTGTCLV